jgi:hypothetical protein
LAEANDGCTETVTTKTQTTAGLRFERAIFGVSNLVQRTQERHFTQPASQLCSGPHPVSVGVRFFVFLFEISQLAADARPPAKLCPSAQACTYRLCRRDF